MNKEKFINVAGEVRDFEKEATGFFGNWAKHSLEKKAKGQYDWRYENSISNCKRIEIDGDYSQWRINKIVAYYDGCVYIANQINLNYNVTDKMHYDYLTGSITKKVRGKRKTEEEKRIEKQIQKESKEYEALITLVSGFYKYNRTRTKEALKILTPEQIDYIKQKQEKGGVT